MPHIRISQASVTERSPTDGLVLCESICTPSNQSRMYSTRLLLLLLHPLRGQQVCLELADALEICWFSVIRARKPIYFISVDLPIDININVYLWANSCSLVRARFSQTNWEARGFWPIDIVDCYFTGFQVQKNTKFTGQKYRFNYRSDGKPVKSCVKKPIAHEYWCRPALTDAGLLWLVLACMLILMLRRKFSNGNPMPFVLTTLKSLCANNLICGCRNNSVVRKTVMTWWKKDADILQRGFRQTVQT